MNKIQPLPNHLQFHVLEEFDIFVNNQVNQRKHSMIFLLQLSQLDRLLDKASRKTTQAQQFPKIDTIKINRKFLIQFFFKNTSQKSAKNQSYTTHRYY